MSVITSSGTDSEELLAAARAGDHRAFEALVAADHQRAVHLHCYRMLGSLQDAQDATQETLVRAWRSLAGFEQRAPLRHWLYRIATTTCLKMLAARDRRPVSFTDLCYLQPYPDRLLDQMPAADPDPAAAAESRETVALAFIAALQLLPASQRAVLMLRDVLAWRAAEVADLLETSIAAVNSALQRARTTIRTAAPTPIEPPSGALDARDREVVDRFVAAWQRNDVPALAALLHEDVILRMPPERAEFAGRAAVAAFFATVPAGGRLDRIPLTVTGANGQPCLAAYLTGSEGSRREPYGLMVLTVASGEVSAITGFPDPALFTVFGLASQSGTRVGTEAAASQGQLGPRVGSRRGFSWRGRSSAATGTAWPAPRSLWRR